MIYWKLVLRTFNRVRRDDCMGLASQAAFGAVLSVVPGLVCLVSFASTIGLSDETIALVVSSLAGLLPSGSLPIVEASVRAALARPAPGLLTTSIVLTLWSASGMLATYTKGINVAYSLKPRYAYWRHRGISLLLVVAIAVPLTLASLASLFGRAVGRYAAGYLGTGFYEALLWGAGRWIATFALVTFVVALVYYIALAERPRPYQLLPGAVAATAMWAVLSIGFNLFTASKFAHYSIYGGLAAAVVFLFWVYLSSAALLIGAVLNAELSRMLGEIEEDEEED